MATLVNSDPLQAPILHQGPVARSELSQCETVK